jgi:hypothetical protein
MASTPLSESPSPTAIDEKTNAGRAGEHETGL